MKKEMNPYHVLVLDYLAVHRRISGLIEDHSKATRETAENLICRGL